MFRDLTPSPLPYLPAVLLIALFCSLCCIAPLFSLLSQVVQGVAALYHAVMLIGTNRAASQEQSAAFVASNALCA